MSYLEELISRKEKENSFSLLESIIKENDFNKLTETEVNMLDKHFEVIKETPYAHKLMCLLFSNDFKYDYKGIKKNEFLGWFNHIQKYSKLEQQYSIDLNKETPFLIFIDNLDRQGYSFNQPPNNLFILDAILSNTTWEDGFLKKMMRDKPTMLNLKKYYVLLKGFQKYNIELFNKDEYLTLTKQIITNTINEKDLNQLYVVYNQLNNNKKIKPIDDLTGVLSLIEQKIVKEGFDKNLLLKTFLPKLLTYVRSDNKNIKAEYTLEKERLVEFISENKFTEQQFRDIYFSDTEKTFSILRRGQPINENVVLLALNEFINKYNELAEELGFKKFKPLNVQEIEIDLSKLDIIIEKIKIESNFNEQISNENTKTKLKL
jgi:hypothetical protein